MKIGILIHSVEDLANWQLRIIKDIIDNPETELALLIHASSAASMHVKSSKNKMGNLLLQTQFSIEKLLYKQKFTVDKKHIIKQLKTRNTLELPLKKDDLKKIEERTIDLLVNLEINAVEESLLRISKYGVWSLEYGDDYKTSSTLAGFWEVALKQSYVEVNLQQRKSERDSSQIIDKAFFNRHWSYFKTNRLVLEGAVSLLLKNIRKLQIDANLSTKEKLTNKQPNSKPNFLTSLKYAMSFYSKAINKSVRDINSAVFGARYRCWTLFIGEGEFMNATLSNLKPTKMPKDEFWADPFVMDYKGEKFIFFENYSYKTKRGKVSCGKVSGNQLIDVEDVLDVDYHLSFPYVFEENGELFLMPETKENSRLELYKCVEFPGKWELYTTAFEGEKVADAFFYDDDDDQRWLFINKKTDLNAPADSELYIYKVSSLKLDHLVPHNLNPVIINARTARNGGTIFKHNNEMYRPSQANINGVYGNALNINKIERLTIDDYVEKTIQTIPPSFHEGLISTHHLHQAEGLFVIDGAYKKK